MNLTFRCSCDSTRHLITRVREHLDFNSIQRSAIKDHILSYNIFSDVQHGLKSFTVIIKCQLKFQRYIKFQFSMCQKRNKEKIAKIFKIAFFVIATKFFRHYKNYCQSLPRFHDMKS